MKPTIGKLAGLNKSKEENKPYSVREFVEINTHQNITMKREFLYLEDVKEAININTLEERIILKRWLINQLQNNKSKEKLIQAIFDSMDKDRHILQKRFNVTV